jgi:hypothetical protein
MRKPALLIFIAFLISLGANCDIAKTNDKKASPNYTSEPRDDFGFRQIKAGNNVILIVSVQEEFAVTVEGEKELLGEVKTKTEGETLVISTSGKISPGKKIRLRISMPELLGLELWGASEATVTNVKSDSIKLQIGGSSTLQISGETKSLTAAANGASKIDAENLKTENADVKTAGTSEITVSAANDLTAEALGASTVYYTSEPKNIKQNIIGTSEIRKK